MYSQSIPRVEMEWDALTRDLDAEFDQRMGLPPIDTPIRFPRPPGIEDDPVAIRRPSTGRRLFRSVARFSTAVVVGIGATVAWQSHGDATIDMIAARAPSLGRLLSDLTPKSPAMAATAPDPVRQLEPLAFNLDIVRRSVEQLAARQEQLAENIAVLQAVVDEVRRRVSTPPPAPPSQPPAASVPQHKPR